jgi:hypothetical protein
MKKVRLFLASSNELEQERRKFEIEIYRKCKAWIDKGIFLHLDIWEDLSARMSAVSSQSEYNKFVKSSDLFVILGFTKMGMYSAEEFETAFGQFKSNQKPFIFTYFKQTPQQEESLTLFKQKLADLGHFYCPFVDSNDLWNQFNKELERLEADGFDKNENTAARVTNGVTVASQTADKIYNIGEIGTANFS